MAKAFRKFWAMTAAPAAADDGPREGIITIDGAVFDNYAWWLYDGETSGMQFRADLDALGLGANDRLLINNNSLGGDLQSGIMIHNIIREHPAQEKICRIQSGCASAATIIAAACTVEMYNGTGQLIHCCADMPDYDATLTADDHLLAAENLQKWDEAMVGIYAAKTGQTPDAILAQMKRNTWMTAQECLAFGLADRIIGEQRVVACADKYNKHLWAVGGRLMDFRNLPEPTFLAQEEESSAASDGADTQHDTALTIAVDIDGVLAEYDSTVEYDPAVIGAPMTGAAEFLTRLRDAGHTVIIHTCRAAEIAIAWLDEHALAYSSVWDQPGKPLANAYLDDRACCFHGDFNAAYDCVSEGKCCCDDMEMSEPPAPESTEEAQLAKRITIEQFAALRPDIVADLHARGVTAERARQIELDELLMEDNHELISAARQDGTPVADVTRRIIATAKQHGRGMSYLAQRLADADTSRANNVNPDPAPNGAPTDAQVAIAAAASNIKAGIV